MNAKEQFWSRIKRANPGFDAPPDTIVKLSLAECRKLVDKAHDAGFASGMDVARTNRSKSVLDSDLFGDLLKGKKL